VNINNILYYCYDLDIGNTAIIFKKKSSGSFLHWVDISYALIEVNFYL